MKKHIITTIVIISVLGFCYGSYKETQKIKVEEKAYLETLREEDRIGYFISKELKGKVSTGKNKLSTYYVNKTENGYDIIITINANEYQNESEILKWVEKEMTKIYTMLYRSDYDIANVRINANFPMMDDYGNVRNGTLHSTWIDRETAKNINWKQDDSILQYQILPKLWNKY